MLPIDQQIGVDDCNCHATRRAARQISRLYDSYLEPTGLRITQFLILATLNERGGMAVSALAERLDTERTAMGKMVGVLEQDGLVRIKPSPTDARSRVVEITAMGTEIFEIGAPLWRDAQRRFSEINSSANVTALRRELAKMKTESEPNPF